MAIYRVNTSFTVVEDGKQRRFEMGEVHSAKTVQALVNQDYSLYYKFDLVRQNEGDHYQEKYTFKE